MSGSERVRVGVILPVTLRRRAARAGDLFGHLHGTPLQISSLVRQALVKECAKIEADWAEYQANALPLRGGDRSRT